MKRWGIGQLGSRVSVSKWKTWKTQTLKTCFVTPEYCIYLYSQALLVFHTKTIYKYSYFFLYVYIYIYIYIYTYTYVNNMYLSTYMMCEKGDRNIFCIHSTAMPIIFDFPWRCVCIDRDEHLKTYFHCDVSLRYGLFCNANKFSPMKKKRRRAKTQYTSRLWH